MLGEDLVILDEAQRIKNWKTQTAQAVKQIIVEYIDRYKLGPLFRFLDRHLVLDRFGKVKGYTDLRLIHQTLKDIMLRRTKKEIMDQLPDRIDKNLFVELTRDQKAEHDCYEEAVSRFVNLWIKRDYLAEEEKQKLLIHLSCMRMVCDSTYMLNPKSNHGNKIGELEELLAELLENQGNKVIIFTCKTCLCG